MLLAAGRHGRPGHGRRDQHQGGPAPAALRVVAPAAPLRLPRRRARAAAPAVDRPGVPRLARPRPSSGGALWALAAGAVLVWRVGAAAVRAACATGCGSPRWCREGDGVVSVYVTGRHLDRLPRRGRPVLHLALPRPARAGPGPTPTRCRPPPTAAACGSPCKDARRRQRARCPRCARAPACWSRAPTAGSAHRARTRRKVALIGAGVGITPLRALAEGLDYAPGRRRPAAPLHRRPAVRGASSTCWPASAGCRCCALPGRRRADGLLARRRRGAADDLTALRHWVPDLAERDVYVCGPDGLDRRGRADASRPPASRPTTSTSRPSAGDPMKTHRACGS